jgi:predicted nucleic acid-binding Zn ribbon protein
MIQTERQLNLAYEAYVDRLHDEAYGECDYCNKCDAPVEWWSDNFEAYGYECEECGDKFTVVI